ncbi:drug resistance transporter, EmrB/QacA subfamily [Beijerinckia sp. 28-YEA-48]|nr:drug resistance transporter, EmrB/QacA subfamily [Beijerinckia sp. 28-YEA-48]
MLQWIINGYLLPLSALLLLGGAVGDRFGRARLLVLGILIFTFASMLCAASQSISWLIFGRVVQGIGAAILLPNSLAILADAFAGAQRGRAIGVWAAAAAIVGAVGPVLGGWLIDTVGWRAIFLLNIPLAIAAIVLTFLFIKDSQSGSIGVRLDTFGGVLATVGLGALTWALTMGAGREGWTFPAFIAFAVGGLAMFAFVWFESKQGERAMMPLTLFGSKMFVGLTLLTFFLYGALGGLMVLLPYVLIESEYHYSGTAAGAALLPFPLVIALGSPAMGWLADRIGPRWPLTVGSAVAAAGYCLMLRIDGAGSYWTAVFPAVLVVSIGMAMAVAPLTNAVLASVDAAHTGSASGFNSAVSRVGGLIATALLGASLGTSGQELIVSSHAAALIGTGMAAVASASAFLLVRDQ